MCDPSRRWAARAIPATGRGAGAQHARGIRRIYRSGHHRWTKVIQQVWANPFCFGHAATNELHYCRVDSVECLLLQLPLYVRSGGACSSPLVRRLGPVTTGRRRLSRMARRFVVPSRCGKAHAIWLRRFAPACGAMTDGFIPIANCVWMIVLSSPINWP